MARTVVPPPPASEFRSTSEGADDDAGDSLPEKLTKYVPAETLAFFVPSAAAIGSGRDTLLIAILILAAFGTIGYLWWNGRALPPKKQPLPHFYVLAVLAFAAWAVATTPSVATLVRADSVISGLVLLAAVFLIPLADGVLNELNGRKAKRT